MARPDLGQWFTPFWAAEELTDALLQDLGQVNVLEPSCGTGAFLAAVPSNLHALGVEIDPALAPIARRNSGREVAIGDFTAMDFAGSDFHLILGNPPFQMETVEAFIDQGHRILPNDGVMAFILPAYAFQTPSRVTSWMDRFSIDVAAIPRTLFPGISMPLVWAKYIKTTGRRFTGLVLFRQTADVEAMSRHQRDTLASPGTWRNVVADALSALGGRADLSEIYEAIVPARRSSDHWRPKVRQTLGRHFTPVARGQWALPIAA